MYSLLPRFSPSARLRGAQSTSRSFVGLEQRSRTSRTAATDRSGVVARAAATRNKNGDDADFVDVAIVGGGPGGLAAALAIERAAPGTRVAVFERARSLKPVGFTIGLMGKRERFEIEIEKEEHSIFFLLFLSSDVAGFFTSLNPDLSSSLSFPPGNGIAALEALDPELGASVFARLLPDAPMENFDPVSCFVFLGSFLFFSLSLFSSSFFLSRRRRSKKKKIFFLRTRASCASAPTRQRESSRSGTTASATSPGTSWSTIWPHASASRTREL
jgi:hypothetical protein